MADALPDLFCIYAFINKYSLNDMSNILTSTKKIIFFRYFCKLI